VKESLARDETAPGRAAGVDLACAGAAPPVQGRRRGILLDLAGLLSSGSVGVGGAVVAPMAGPEQAADESGAATPAFKPG